MGAAHVTDQIYLRPSQVPDGYMTAVTQIHGYDEFGSMFVGVMPDKCDVCETSGISLVGSLAEHSIRSI